MSLRTNTVKVQAFAGALFGIQLGTTFMAQANACCFILKTHQEVASHAS